MSETQPETQPEPETPDTPDMEPEPVEPDEGDDLGPEPEIEIPAEDRPAAPTQEEIEKKAQAGERSFKQHEKRVFAIYEDMAHDLFECPLCPDMHKGFLNVHDAGRVPQEIKDVVMQYLGFARQVDYPHSSQHRTCQECDGHGKVTTGSKVPGKETIGCAACHGTGFIGPQAAASNGHTEVEPGLTGPTVFGVETPQDEVDEWQEPRILPDGRENPNFGKMPNRKILVEPWGRTAGLTAQDAVSA